MDLVLTYRGTVMRALFGMLGLSSAYLRDNRRALAAVEQHLQYKRELVAGDNVAVSSGVLEIKEKAVRFFHEMRDALSGEGVRHQPLRGRASRCRVAQVMPVPRRLRRACEAVRPQLRFLRGAANDQ
jgi:acyl-CoA thioester hydrolase